MMTRTAGRRVRWLIWLAAGSLGVVLGVLMLVTRLTEDQLSTADQVASVVAAAVAVLGVPIAVYGVVLARRGTGPVDPAARATRPPASTPPRLGSGPVLFTGDVTATSHGGTAVGQAGTVNIGPGGRSGEPESDDSREH